MLVLSCADYTALVDENRRRRMSMSRAHESRPTRFASAIAAATLCCCALAPLARAQDSKPPQMTPEQQAEMKAYEAAGKPGEPHRKMAAMAGDYNVKVRSWHEPGAPAMEETGKATRKIALDGRVLVEQFEGTMMGAPFTGHGMSGYDNVTGKYWSTWNDSMSTGLMVSSGSCDAQGACTFEGSYNDPVRKAPVKIRMTTRWTSPDTEVFEMHGPDKQGREMKMMEMTYTRSQ
jgi:hypothetical protein